MTILAAAALMSAIAAPAVAQATQEKPAPPPKMQAKVDVVITRYQGDKKVASQPYMMMPTINTSNGGYASLRIGVDVPIGTTTTTRPPNANGTPGVTTTEPKYQNVGTNMDCQVNPLPDGRFEVMVSVTDSSLFSPDGSAFSTRPSEASAFRTFQGRNTLIMRDGQTMLLTTATDKVTGEVIKVEVTFTLIK
jgi:hypothetical protein